MGRRSFIVIAIVAGTLLAIQPALACDGSEVYLQDDFTTFAADWSHNNGDWAGSGMLLITPALREEQGALNSTSLPNDIDACVDVLFASGDLTPGTPQLGRGAYAGLMFWAKDFINNYKFLVAPQGTYAVTRVFTQLKLLTRHSIWLRSSTGRRVPRSNRPQPVEHASSGDQGHPGETLHQRH